MRASVAFLVLGLTGALELSASGEPAPPAARAWSFPIDELAAARISAIPREDLLSDAVFVRTLSGILTSSLSIEGKVDAFTLMLDRIGWLFAGSQRLFPNRGYLGTFGGQATTYFAYQEQLDQHRSLAPDFFSLSRVNCSKNVVRCSSGLLLAALVGPQAAGAEVTRLVDSSAELSAEVPDILIHSITLAAALSRDTETVLGLVPLLNRASSEESREDVICALALYSSPAAVAAITAFVEAQLPASQDNAVQTGLAAAKLRLDSDEFEAWQGRLRASLNSERKEVLDDIGARGFLPPMLSSEPLVKLWDGIGTVIYDDGMQLLHPSGFSYFRGR